MKPAKLSTHAWDELAELRRVFALSRGYIREQLEGTRAEEHAYRARLVAQLERVSLHETAPDEVPHVESELRRSVLELTAQVQELTAVLDAQEAQEYADERQDDEREAERIRSERER